MFHNLCAPFSMSKKFGVDNFDPGLFSDFAKTRHHPAGCSRIRYGRSVLGHLPGQTDIEGTFKGQDGSPNTVLTRCVVFIAAPANEGFDRDFTFFIAGVPERGRPPQVRAVDK